MLINNQIYRRLGVVAEILFPEKKTAKSILDKIKNRVENVKLF